MGTVVMACNLRDGQHHHLPLKSQVFPLVQSRSGTCPVPYALADTSTLSSHAWRNALGMVHTKPVLYDPTGNYASVRRGPSYVLSGNAGMAAQAKVQITASTFVQDVHRQRTEHSLALEQRRLKPCTPYKVDTWCQFLRIGGLLQKYERVLDGLRFGFTVDFSSIQRTQAPPNKSSICTFRHQFDEIIVAEIRKGRYIGPMSNTKVVQLIGPFQSSPFSITEKPAKPGKY